MEKLELKHLCAYLPYGVKIKDCLITKPFVLDSVNLNSVLSDIEHLNTTSLILRPLSDLTKEIYHNGEKFVPIEWFEKNINKTIILYNPIYEDLDLQIDIDTEDYSQTIDLFEGYKSVQKLLSWHFDVFRLIDKGLAIDINNLK